MKGVTYKTALSQKLFMVWTLALHTSLGLPEAMFTYLGSEAGRAGSDSSSPLHYYKFILV